MPFKTPEKTKAIKLKRKKLKVCTPTIVSSDLKIVGNLKSEGIIEVEGEIEGNVESLKINVRHSGSIKGDVVADSVDVSGEVNGLLKARNINITKTAKVSGVLIYESISIMDGAFVDGQFKVTQDIDDFGNITKVNFKDSKLATEDSKNQYDTIEQDDEQENETEHLTNAQ